MKRFLFSVVSIIVSVGAASADEPPPELKLLEDYVGTWDEVVSNKATEWIPEAGKVTSVTKKTWAMGNKFVRMEGKFTPGDNDFLSLLTYDPHAKVYRTWYFDSGGGMPRGSMTGKWDERTCTMTWTGADDDGNKTLGKTHIIDKDNHEWTMVVTNPAGKVVLDLSATNKRRKD